METAKHKLQKLAINPATQKLVNFLHELQKLAKDASGIAVHAILGQLIYAKMPPHLEKLMNQAHLVNCTNQQIVIHLEKEIGMNELKAPDELQIKTVSHKTANTIAEKLETKFHDCKKPGHYRNRRCLQQRHKKQSEDT